MDWRVANSLIKLRQQINGAYPGRNTASDGTIGDPAHQFQGSYSDHNPWFNDSNGVGVVTALDITHDPKHGLDIWKLAQAIKADKRVKYLIANEQIWINGEWFDYGGDPHRDHLHVSVNVHNYDDATKWNIKKEEEMVTENGVARIYRLRLGKAPSKAALKRYVGKYTEDKADKEVARSDEYKTRIKAAKAGKLKVQEHLPAELRNAYKPPVTTLPGVKPLGKGIWEVK